MNVGGLFEQERNSCQAAFLFFEWYFDAVFFSLVVISSDAPVALPDVFECGIASIKEIQVQETWNIGKKGGAEWGQIETEKNMNCGLSIAPL